MVFAESLISFPQLLPLAIFGLFAVAAWWLLELVATTSRGPWSGWTS